MPSNIDCRLLALRLAGTLRGATSYALGQPFPVGVVGEAFTSFIDACAQQKPPVTLIHP